MVKWIVIVGLLVFYSYSQALENWPRFRGNNGDGYADCNIPHSWIIPPIAGPYHLTMKVMDPPQYGVTVYL
jgi:hypothetical protein